MLRIMRQKTINNLVDQAQERGRADATKELIACIREFAKDGGGTYYFEPVQAQELTVTGNAFFVHFTAFGTTNVGGSMGVDVRGP